jgi:hypothetical protein
VLEMKQAIAFFFDSQEHGAEEVGLSPFAASLGSLGSIWMRSDSGSSFCELMALRPSGVCAGFGGNRLEDNFTISGSSSQSGCRGAGPDSGRYLSARGTAGGSSP